MAKKVPQSVLESVIRERIAQHQENLQLWETGTLAPTEPDPEERRQIMDRLRVAIEVLKTVLQDARLPVGD